MRVNGRVKFFNLDKGWGFITRDDGTGDVFVHLTEVRRVGRPALQEGQAVSFEVVAGKDGKGPRATDLRLL